MRTLLLAALAVLCAGAGIGAQKLEENPSTRQAPVILRGNCVMGFSAAKTTHHFRLFAEGGETSVRANKPDDTASRDMIRMHLSHIAAMFGEGDFQAPMLIHDTTPPGVPTMKRLHARIHYQYEAIPAGGRVRIETRDRQALDAVHAFLLFQILEHRTGDSGAIAPQPKGRQSNTEERPVSVRPAVPWAGCAPRRAGHAATGTGRSESVPG